MHHIKQITVLVMVFIFAATLLASDANLAKRIQLTTSFEQDWRFIQKDVSGGEAPGFDDASWQTVRIPHDWSIEGPFDRENPTGRGGAYLPAGAGWYRKTFQLPADRQGCQVYVEFDGIMANSDVWLNGVHIGKRPFGYVSLVYDLTEHVKFGDTKNVLAVRADNTVQPASRWYSGAGIYRHARLTITDPVHIAPWGVFVSTPRIDTNQAIVKIQTTVFNQSKKDRQLVLRSTILGPDGLIAASVISSGNILAGGSFEFEQQVKVVSPKLWDIDSPNRYHVDSILVEEEKVLDDNIQTTFGIRSFDFKADTGFWLNGKNIKIKGVCLHHDCGALGAAVPTQAWQRRLEQLKKIGVNGIRTAHNPVNPEFLDLCDQMGFVVMHEVLDTWTASKNNAQKGYNLYFKEWWQKDTADTVRRDRNHPSIVIYSGGNEIRDNLNSPQGFEQFKAIRDLYHKLDPTRPVTLAVFRPNQSQIYDNGFAELMDVVGQNYRVDELLEAHKQKPQRKIISTENGYDRESWLQLRDNAFYAGQFLWAGIEYLGESDWPKVAHTEDMIDRTGAWKPRAYQRQSWWSAEPMVHIARLESASGGGGVRSAAGELYSNWTPRDVDTYDEAVVEVYSNCQEVELFLNGKSQGVWALAKDASPRVWKMPFEEGKIRAEGKNDGKVAAVHEMQTAGPAAKIIVSVDRAKLGNKWDDVSYVTATVVDEKGIPCPWADDLITFEITGPGKIIAVDNADPFSHDTFRTNKRKAYQGRCIAIIQASAPDGNISVNVRTEGLKSNPVSIEIVR